MLKYLYFLIIINSIRADGNFKTLGSFGKFFSINETFEHLSTKFFFENYVKTNTPLLMRGIAKEYKAIKKWSDSFLKNELFNYDEDYNVYIETSKKENREVETGMILFKTFLEEYNTQDWYMVSSVPEFLKSDVLLPNVIQCQPAPKMLDRTIMWFSSGGTKTLAHVDEFENILCLFNGRKRVILIDPHKFFNVVIDSPDRLYSKMDVDKIDFEKYPGIENLEYFSINMNSGDCIYIPYKWIHQVDSLERNIAVSFWFNYDIKTNEELPDACMINNYDESLTLDKLDYESPVVQYRKFITREVLTGNRHIDQWKIILANGAQITEDDIDVLQLSDHVQEIFDLMDFNGDGIISDEELNGIDNNVYELILNAFEDFYSSVNKIKQKDIHNEL